ncbi:hypothetical protein [Noviluteimonas gilva]|uniref:Transmembrane protein n=1 Tax=Noviluteimonas gilva TaxID=2682097 RepID=A0A7C9HLL5_9GAMM|nr:hypothetical protein [Lysobacter gilvus]MUV13835.1 hypothetical protein [Lysobacter gilvus]
MRHIPIWLLSFFLFVVVLAATIPFGLQPLINHQVAQCQTDTGFACSLGATVVRWWWLALLPLCALLATGVVWMLGRKKRLAS